MWVKKHDLDFEMNLDEDEVLKYKKIAHRNHFHSFS